MTTTPSTSSIVVTFHQGALPAATSWQADGAGAAVTFEGIVRPGENGQAIAGLVYEAYQPMATNQLRKLATQVMAEHQLLALQVEHSEGEVVAGACSFRLRVAAMHRGPALAAMAQFIDRMKQQVPIWKKVILSVEPTDEAERPA